MIQNIEDVIKFLKVQKLEYWTVQVKEGDNGYVFKADENLHFDDNVKNFREIMSLSTGSRFFLKASSQKVGNKGNFYEEFKNVSESSGYAVNGLQNNQPGVRGFTEDEVDRKISEALEKERSRREVEAVKEENQELKRQIDAVNTPINRVIGKLEPYIGGIIQAVVGSIIPKRPGMQIAGTGYNINFEPVSDQGPDNTENPDQVISPESETEPDEVDNYQNRLATALQKWASADPEFISLIEAVADLASNNDPLYAMAKNMLKK